MEVLITEKSENYELIDSGDGEKLERYGEFVLSRPDPQAIWSKSSKDWQADAIFTRTGKTGTWRKIKEFEEWKVSLEGLTFNLKLFPSKHLGVFPEQTQNWKWLEGKITAEKIKSAGRPISVLNLFAYTGGATLACARAGAAVVHVDASEFAVDLAKKNLSDSGLGEKEVRFMVDDVRKFVEREIKRGNKYDCIVLDPPAYGKIGTGKTWNLESDLRTLLQRVKELISDNPITILINGYASGYSHIAYEQLLKEIISGGEFSSGELAIKDSRAKLLPAGIWARWNN